MTEVEKLAKEIADWEYNAGETFPDYFMHDTIADKTWAEWLIANGHEERGKAILKEYYDHFDKGVFICMDQEFLYSVYSRPDFEESMGYKGVVTHECLYDIDDDDPAEEFFQKDFLLWAQFLIDHPNYLAEAKEFLKTR